MKKRRNAYEIPFDLPELSEEERRQAVAWWQQGEAYLPLICPVCARPLVLARRGVTLECPALWCAYTCEEVPWGLFAAWKER